MGKTKEQRREESLARGEKAAAMSPQERLEQLDAKLGVGVGAKRERARLAAMITPESELLTKVFATQDSK